MKQPIGFVAVVLFSCPLFAQNNAFPSPAACGDLNVRMTVNLNDSKHDLTQPKPGMAQIYFLQDTGLSITIAYPTTRIGIDGEWVGANKKDSYFSAFVPPGEHHLCVAIQSSFVRNNIELAHLTAEAGKIYYFRTRILYSRDGLVYLTLAPADSDEAKFLIESFPLATAHARK